MKLIRNHIRLAARRLFLSRFLFRLHLLCLVSASIWLVSILLDKFTAVNLPVFSIGIAFLVLSVISAAIWAGRVRFSEMQIAAKIDERLSLDERLSTALQCSGSDDPFARAAMEDGRQIATRPDLPVLIRSHFRISGPRRAWIAPVIVLIAIGAYFLPSHNLFRQKDEPQPIVSERIREISYQVDHQLEEIREKTRDLQKAAEVSGGNEDNNNSPDDSMIRTDPIRERIREITTEQKRLEAFRNSDKVKAFESIQEQMRKLHVPGKGDAAKLASTIQKGDFEKAQQAIEELAEKMRSKKMSSQDKKNLAAQMKNLAQQMEDLANKQQEELKKKLAQAGIDAAAASDPQALQEALNKAQNLSQQQKQSLMSAVRQNSMMQQKMSSMSKSLNGVSSSLNSSNMGQALQNLAQVNATMADLDKIAQGVTISEEAMLELQKLAQSCGTASGGNDSLSISQAPPRELDWRPGTKDKMSRGPGMGSNAGIGAGGEAHKIKTRFRFERKSLRTILTGGPIMSETVRNGQVRGQSKVQLQAVIREITEGIEQGITDDQVPREYQQPTKKYFDSLQGLSVKTDKPSSEEEKSTDEKSDSEKSRTSSDK